MSKNIHENRLMRMLRLPAAPDRILLLAVVTLMLLGLIMLSSASISIGEKRFGGPLFFFWRQLAYVVLALVLAGVAMRVPLSRWYQASPMLLIVGIALLVLVLMPGLGRTYNGSTRWLYLGVINLQVSELVKVFFVLYLSGYLVRRGREVQQSISGFLKPLSVLALFTLLLLLEPDFGAVAVMTLTVIGMMFLAGVGFGQFLVLFLGAVVALAVMALSSPYRLERLTTFINPWSDPFNSGFQLTQALIAFGRGEWLGVGLGQSVQKLFYLPEAHTDFLYAVLAEELGMIGALSVMALFALVVWRAFVIAAQARVQGDAFGMYLAYGIGLLIGVQALINVGVNTGVLPTKGLTLPLMSYGGSSTIATAWALALLLRIDMESRKGSVRTDKVQTAVRIPRLSH